MRAVCLILGLVTGCSVGSEAGRARDRVQLRYSIDVTFSDAQADAIRMGLEFWQAELTNVDIVEEPRQRCTVETERCFVAVVSEDPSLWDEESQRFASGQFHGGRASVSLDKNLRMSALPILTAHEFGHRLGLRHDESIEGVMNAHMGEETPWELNDAQLSFLEGLNLI